MITVGRVNGVVPKGALAIRADRKSSLGNPFYMADESKRDDVCNKFEEWMKQQLLINPKGEFCEALREVYRKSRGGHVHLQCWCAPKRCHCNSIKNFIDEHTQKPRS